MKNLSNRHDYIAHRKRKPKKAMQIKVTIRWHVFDDRAGQVKRKQSTLVRTGYL